VKSHRRSPLWVRQPAARGSGRVALSALDLSARVNPPPGYERGPIGRLGQSRRHATGRPSDDSVDLYLRPVAPRSRFLAFGSTAAAVVAGALCAVLVDGLTGEVLAIALVLVGLGGAVLLLFLEVGLSEDQARARDARRRRERPGSRLQAQRRPPVRRRPRWPG
jgi:hypothetical protein